MSPYRPSHNQMSRVGKVNWKRFEKFLLAVGCEFKGQEGSHRKYRKPDLLRPIIIPCDSELPQFIILNNLRTLGISQEQFAEIMKKL
ncbi:MAG: type II toxin-antitoxin system HicA family toxin [bacterium]